VRCDQHPLPRLLEGGRRQPPSRTARFWLCECKAILGPGRALMAGSQVPLYHGRKRSTVSLRHSVTGIYRTRTGRRSAPRSIRRRRRAQRGGRRDACHAGRTLFSLARSAYLRPWACPVATGQTSSTGTGQASSQRVLGFSGEVTLRGLLQEPHETCPLSTEGGTRRVQLVREGGGESLPWTAWRDAPWGKGARAGRAARG
jgi:hypothetical protein